MKSRILAVAIGHFLCFTPWAPAAEFPQGPSQDERMQIERDLKKLEGRIAADRGNGNPPKLVPVDLADAEIFHKGVVWALRYEGKLEPGDVALVKKALQRAKERLDALDDGKRPWHDKKGKLVRGYTSAVDGSVQPYGLIVPGNLDATKPARLDVVLHGSSRPTGLSELRFMNRFDEGDQAAAKAPDAGFIELHPLGRVENCYRWAGETDVFEAIESVCRNYRIDRERIVLRGMSMGASGTWHLGLKHPDFFVALGPYCGYVDTHEFSKTPLKNFLVVGELPPHQEKTLHMLDSIDYAANAGVVPAIACMGEKDIFFQAHAIMGKAMEKEGLKMVNLISPGTGHVIDPVTHKEQMARIGDYAAKGLDRVPKHLRFVTWTLKYSTCHWLQVLGLEEHYRRAELEASTSDGAIEIKEPKNITRFAVHSSALAGKKPRLSVNGNEVALPEQSPPAPFQLLVERKDGKWICPGLAGAVETSGKQPGLQGPIDDAFTGPFLCVRGTGKPWNPTVHNWSEASLKRFAYEWSRYFRGNLPLKDDRDVTEADVQRNHLILFGDPGSNALIAKVLPKMPIEWRRDELRLGNARYPAADHAPALIGPSPLAKGRYVVFNSGHTFRELELAAVNYLLFPRLGDWAVLQVEGQIPASPSAVLKEKVVEAGFFDEAWRLPAKR